MANSARAVAPQAGHGAGGRQRHQFMDLAGNGEIDVVDFGGPAPGFHERDRDAGWKQHVPFASLPNIDWQDPNLRFVDLTGDGHADALITESEVFTWYPSLDERGFAAGERTQAATDEDAGPRLVFADGTQTIFLADMCGDGLTDLVRIRNGEVCYWPNLGYGRFGRKITLGNSPRFDQPDLFDPSRIRLTDIDGSGPIDIIYLGRDGARLYFNRSGNSLSDARHRGTASGDREPRRRAGRRPAGQRHRLPGVELAPAGRCRPPGPLYRPHGRRAQHGCG